MHYPPGFAVTSPHNLADMARFIENVDLAAVQPLSTDERMLQLGEQIAERRRPEVDLYLVAQVSIEQLAGTLDPAGSGGSSNAGTS